MAIRRLIESGVMLRGFLVSLTIMGTAVGCELFKPVEDDGGSQPPELGECWAPEEWIGQTCEQMCDASGDESTGSEASWRCVAGTKCHGAAAVGYKRHDACIDDQFAMPLEVGCDEPFPPDLTDSIYYVSCCCDRTP